MDGLDVEVGEPICVQIGNTDTDYGNVLTDEEPGFLRIQEQLR